MSIDIEYKIIFYDFWHCSSGLSGGAELDALVVKETNGLPYVPGKTIKGHIKEMAKLLDNDRFIIKCFGCSTEDGHKEIAGDCFFSNARMSQEERDSLESDDGKSLISYLYRKIPSTAINKETQVAKTNSLREIEVVVPLTLEGVIKNCPSRYVDKMKGALKLVKRVGLNRHRGLGRCDFKIEETE